MRAFTATEEQGIRDGRAAGLCWVKVSLIIHRNVADVRTHACGAMELPAVIPGREPKPKPAGDDRAPLPAGDPFTWGLITAGTVLDGVPFRLDVRECAP